MSDFQTNKKLNLLPLPYIGMYDLDLIYQTSDVELLYQILSMANKIAESQNIIIDNFEKVLDWAQNQIEQYTKEQLQQWLDDGTLENLISNMLNISRYYDYTEQIKNSLILQEGMYINVKGYDENNLYNGTFFITSTKPLDRFYITLQNSLYGVLIDSNCNIGCLTNSSITLDSSYSYLNYNDIDINDKTIVLNSNITVKNIHNGNIIGNNEYSLLINNENNINVYNITSNKVSIEADNCKNVSIKNCEIDGLTSNDKGCILLRDCENSIIQENICKNSGLAGIILTSNNYKEISDISKIGCRNVLINGNKCYGNYDGIKGSYYSQNINVTNNECYNSTRDGIDFAVHYGNKIDIYDNNIHDNTLEGIEIKTLDTSSFPTPLNYFGYNVSIHSNNICNNGGGTNSDISCQNDNDSATSIANIFSNQIKLSSRRGIRCSNLNLTSYIYDNTIIVEKFISNQKTISIIIPCKAYVMNNILINSYQNAIEVENQGTQHNPSEIIIDNNYIDTSNDCIGLNLININPLIRATNNAIRVSGNTYPINSGFTGISINNRLIDSFTIVDSIITLENGPKRVTQGIVVYSKNISQSKIWKIVYSENGLSSTASYIKIGEVL